MAANLSFVDVQNILLEEMYHFSNRGSEEYQLDTEGISLLNKYGISRYKEEKATEGLLNRGLLNSHTAGLLSEISAAGIEFIEKNIGDHKSRLIQSLEEVGVSYISATIEDNLRTGGSLHIKFSEFPTRQTAYLHFETFKYALLQFLLRECERNNFGKTNISLFCGSNGLKFHRGWIGQFGEELHEAVVLSFETNLDSGPDDGVEVHLTGQSGDALKEYMNKIADRDERQPGDQPIRFTEFRDQLLVALAKEDREYGGDFFDLVVVADKNNLQYKDGWVRKAAFHFRDIGYIQDAFSHGSEESSGLEAALTGEGLAAAEELAAAKETPAAAQPLFDLVGDDDTVVDNDGMPAITVPASDRYVEVDHNDPKLKEAQEKVKSASEAIRGFNEPTNYDKDQVSRELMFGQQLFETFKNTKVLIGTVVAVILTPLITVYHEVMAETIRPLVEAAINAMKAWLGI